mmetsp:Transcript_1985/g.4512  ORF Transcript_1985/g.4512 Transcript_1985/m.4512 type:complete len:237 (-) Transcript_1985:241-951(-)
MSFSCSVDAGRDSTEQPGHEVVLDLLDEGIVEEACFLHVPKNLRHHVSDVSMSESSCSDLLRHCPLVRQSFSLLLNTPLLLLRTPDLRSLHPLSLCKLGCSDLIELLLMGPHVLQLLLLQDLHQALLQRLAHNDLQDRFDFEVKVEQFPFEDLCFTVHSSFLRYEERCRRSVHERICLSICINFGRSISYLFQEHLCLHIHVLPAWHRIRSRGPGRLPDLLPLLELSQLSLLCLFL